MKDNSPPSMFFSALFSNHTWEMPLSPPISSLTYLNFERTIFPWILIQKPQVVKLSFCGPLSCLPAFSISGICFLRPEVSQIPRVIQGLGCPIVSITFIRAPQLAPSDERAVTRKVGPQVVWSPGVLFFAVISSA